METHLNIEKMETDCGDANLLGNCVLENGGLVSHLGNFEVVDGDCETKEAALHPITPIPYVENGEPGLVKSTSLSSESPQSSTVDEGLHSDITDEVIGSGCDGSPRTPKEGVFNPFAPGPEEICFTPCKKYVKMSRRVVARRLNFDDVSEFPSRNVDDKEVEIPPEMMLFETVYESLLEAIILKLTEDFLAENQDVELEVCGTPISPTSPLPLSRSAEACPGAPARATGHKSRDIDPGLCRKLEF